MPSFADNIVLAILALLLFGPKKLPVLAREMGKWIGEFRRASNEFKMQMEEELRLSEQAERQKKVAEMEAAAPKAPALESTTEATSDNLALESTSGSFASSETDDSDVPLPNYTAPADVPEAHEPAEPLPIATSGELNMMPPSTGLPVPQTKGSPIESLVESIPTVSPVSEAAAPTNLEPSTENAAHGQ